MTRKAKVCLVGATAVGKSSLVARFVRSIFSDQYQTTIGVKIETRYVERPLGRLELVIWDLSGEDEFQNVQLNYLRGATGYLLVIDGTRAETKAVAFMLQERLLQAIGHVPFVVVLNKVDQIASWEVTDRELDAMTNRRWKLVRASALTGVGVEEAFDELSDAILRGPPWT